MKPWSRPSMPKVRRSTTARPVRTESSSGSSGEPIATLLVDGKTVGRHFAGPGWELADGSAVTGKIAGRAAGATSKDIPLLKLDAASHRGSGQLTGVTTIQRLNTKGGVAEGPCEAAGTFLSVPYSADYTFLKKG